ncbi:MAG: nicotinamide-nucleotide amidohydrolase family protein, partial [Dehalococcoidia bacterium]
VESATGGRIGDKITNVPGSSEYYVGSIVSYSNEIKTKVAGVDPETLAVRGAVSSETAVEMAAGGRALLNVDICISDTGIAGPSGDTPGKPVGLFYIGIASDDMTLSEQHRLHGNREENKRDAAIASLNLLKNYLISRIDKLNESLSGADRVVTCFLEYNGKVLLLKRSYEVRAYKGLWAGVSGYITTDAIKQAYIEIQEETGLTEKDIILSAQGKPLEIIDPETDRTWIVHPFLFHVNTPDIIKTDWEHTEIRWIYPDELANYTTVPGLRQTLERVLR